MERRAHSSPKIFKGIAPHLCVLVGKKIYKHVLGMHVISESRQLPFCSRSKDENHLETSPRTRIRRMIGMCLGDIRASRGDISGRDNGPEAGRASGVWETCSTQGLLDTKLRAGGK